jgi:predicted glutamine amidotransferase
MCGLLGHLGNKTNKVNLDKFNILGILNEERGEHSCGVTIDGEILKGIDELKVYRDFVSFYNLRAPNYATGMIGHTRKATYGQHTLENTHPFGFGSIKIEGKKKPIFEFVGVHNGTLLNHTELANNGGLKLTKEIEEIEEYEINNKKTTKTVHKTVTKIDSEILLERLYRDKNYSVLSEYNGAAALIWQDIKKPNTMFFYHGMSKKDQYDKEEIEERPLYYWKENKNSLYVSSLLDSLYVIGGNKTNIGEFKHNVVYEVKNGDIKNAKKTTIDRSGNWKARGYSSAANNRAAGFGGGHAPNANSFRSQSNYSKAWATRANTAYRTSSVSPTVGSNTQLQLNLEVPIDKGLLAEEFDAEHNNGLTQMKQLRYWRTGHLANGIFVYINNKGFKHIGWERRSCLNIIKNLAGQFYYNGDFHNDIPDDTKTDYCMPIDKRRGKTNAEAYMQYFYEGIRQKTYTDWQATNEQAKLGKIKFDIISLSISATHPIIDLETGSSRIKGAYYNGTLANNTYSCLGSNKLYNFKHGQIKNISYIPGWEPKELINPPFLTLDKAAALLDKNLKVNAYTTNEEKDLLRELVSLDKVIDSIKISGGKKVKYISDTVEQRIDNLIKNLMEDDSITYADTLKDMKKFSPSSTKAALAVNILTNLISIE